MHLTPKEEDRLLVFAAAELARRRRARGRPLSAPEAIALITDEMLEAAWDGLPLEEVRRVGCSVLQAGEVMDGVASLVRHLEVDCAFPSGSALVTVDDPVPGAGAHGPGAVIPGEGSIDLAPERRRLEVEVTNRGVRPVAVSSHFPFDQVNRALSFPRAPAAGMRLDIPAGSSVRFEAGERRRVRLVAFGGDGSGPDLGGEGATTPPEGGR
ncbi:MAG TPA: urease subunit gamma [Acidimicrobiales bacterium]|nr:urease subunit gamma [Acidimicrobiales bacterium]